MTRRSDKRLYKGSTTRVKSLLSAILILDFWLGDITELEEGKEKFFVNTSSGSLVVKVWTSMDYDIPKVQIPSAQIPSLLEQELIPSKSNSCQCF